MFIISPIKEKRNDKQNNKQNIIAASVSCYANMCEQTAKYISNSAVRLTSALVIFLQIHGTKQTSTER